MNNAVNAWFVNACERHEPLRPQTNDMHAHAMPHRAITNTHTACACHVSPNARFHFFDSDFKIGKDSAAGSGARAQPESSLDLRMPIQICTDPHPQPTRPAEAATAGSGAASVVKTIDHPAWQLDEAGKIAATSTMANRSRRLPFPQRAPFLNLHVACIKIARCILLCRLWHRPSFLYCTFRLGRCMHHIFAVVSYFSA